MQQLIKHLLNPKRNLFLAIGYTAILLFLFLVKTGGLEGQRFPHADKVFHILAHFGLVVIWTLYYAAKMSSKVLSNKLIITISILATVFGILIEVLQIVFTNYRTADFYDVIADAIGVLLACVALLMLKKSIKKS